MLDTLQFGASLKELGYDFYSGVPCSFLKYLINYAINESEYVMAANEGDAVAICSGVHLAGRKGVVLMQNSGLGNAVSPLTSLNSVFNIPVLGFVSLRGEPGLSDEPQHELMGVITGELLSVMRISWAVLETDMDLALCQLKEADEVIKSGKPFFFIVRKNSFSQVCLNTDTTSAQLGIFPDRWSMINAVCSSVSEKSVIVATTGFTGRELYQSGDKSQKLYMVGSMGCVSSLCLGLSLTKPDLGVIALDGDGSALMRMGALPVLSAYRPKKLLHILFDNCMHESTGGQDTISSNIDWVKFALAVGYTDVGKILSSDELSAAVEAWESAGGLRFLYVRTRLGTVQNLKRPVIKPYEVKQRIINFIKEQ